MIPDQSNLGRDPLAASATRQQTIDFIEASAVGQTWSIAFSVDLLTLWSANDH
jgi:hypothetical protein